VVFSSRRRNPLGGTPGGGETGDGGEIGGNREYENKIVPI